MDNDSEQNDNEIGAKNIVKIPFKESRIQLLAWLVELYVELMNFNRRLNFGRQQGSHDLWYVKVGHGDTKVGQLVTQ